MTSGSTDGKQHRFFRDSRDSMDVASNEKCKFSRRQKREILEWKSTLDVRTRIRMCLKIEKPFITQGRMLCGKCSSFLGCQGEVT